MIIRTVAELREYIKDIPDETIICIPLSYCEVNVDAEFYYDEEDGSISIIDS